MFEEDFQAPGAKTPTEVLVAWHLCVLIVFSSWAFGGAIYWADGFIFAIGLFAPVPFLVHLSSGFYKTTGNARRYLLASVPFWLLALVFVARAFNPSLTTAYVGEEALAALREAAGLLPASTLWVSAVVPFFAGAFLYLCALNLFFVVETRFLLKRMLYIGGLSAVVLAGLGFLQQSLESTRILGFLTAPHAFFFSTFVHPSHWCGFALLWASALLGLSNYLKHRQRWRVWLFSPGFLCFAGGVLLLLSVFSVGNFVFRFAAAILAGITLVLYSLDHFRETRGVLRWGVPAVFLGAALALLAYSLSLFVETVEDVYRPVAKTATNDPQFELGALRPIEHRLALIEDSLELAGDRPAFGWGPESFGIIQQFHQQADLPQTYYEHPRSDLMLALVEGGGFALIVWGAAAAGFLAMLGRARSVRTLTTYLVVGCALVAAIGVIDTPFSSPALKASWWVLLAAGVRWSLISPLNAPVASSPSVVFSHEEMAQPRVSPTTPHSPEAPSSTEP